MNRALISKCIGESKWLLAACAAAMFAFSWIRVWIVSRVEMDRFKAILDLLPSDWLRFSPVEIDQLVTYPGRVSLTYDEPIVVLCLSVWAIARGSDVVSGEINRGTMEMLLAQPLSRLQVLITQSLVTLFGVGVLSLSVWLGIYAGLATNTVREKVTPSWKLPFPAPLVGSEIPIPFAKPQVRESLLLEKVDPDVFWPATANLFALGVLLAGVTALMSSWDRYRWRTIGIMVGAYVIQLIVKVVGMASDQLEWLMYCSVFTAYEPEAFVSVAVNRPADAWSINLYGAEGQWVDLGPGGYSLILIVLGCLSYIAAASIFHRRDLPAPL